MSIENRRGTRSPPIPKPSTRARLRVRPCQVVVTRQLVLPLAASRLTPSIRANIVTPVDVRNAVRDAHKDGKRVVLMRLKSDETTKFVAVPIARA